MSRPWSPQAERLNRWEAYVVECRVRMSPTRPPALFLAVHALATRRRTQR